ncbi:TadE/TadG family type IV pilus assembly protein [Alteraurantiacibacter buctensis]|uniref:TadE-like domain-containing protein n=1 Tax=Alteraurantiacibacter buctensis TaxID=1503981 RepID=A0A844Z1X5_9SPHN|nr:TadE/TadG family type IV pilus assembly protein [Alteraurantiacibacter buctensis]MXO73348.1 hypothetical protein [Alteraurantiacibacter buctensis]
MTGARSQLSRIGRADGAVATTEFALLLPLFLVLGVGGVDTASYILTHMRMSQLALQVADNASRMGERNVLVSRKVYESDINDVFIGARQAASGLDIAGRGRIILSSLERNADGGQWIHWQRCTGTLARASAYGPQGTGATGTAFPGMGPAGTRITAGAGDAVMFVEVAYRYHAVSGLSPFDGRLIVYTGSYNVRDARDLTQVYQTTPAAMVATCS